MHAGISGRGHGDESVAGTSKASHIATLELSVATPICWFLSHCFSATEASSAAQAVERARAEELAREKEGPSGALSMTRVLDLNRCR